MKTRTRRHPHFTSVISAIGGTVARHTAQSERDEWVRYIEGQQKNFSERHGLQTTPAAHAAAHAAAVLEVERRLAGPGQARAPFVTDRQLAEIARAHMRRVYRLSHPGVVATWWVAAAIALGLFGFSVWWGWSADLSYYPWPVGTPVGQIENALSAGSTFALQAAACVMGLTTAVITIAYWIRERAHLRGHTPIRDFSIEVAKGVVLLAAVSALALDAYQLGTVAVFGTA